MSLVPLLYTSALDYYGRNRGISARYIARRSSEWEVVVESISSFGMESIIDTFQACLETVSSVRSGIPNIHRL